MPTETWRLNTLTRFVAGMVKPVEAMGLPTLATGVLALGISFAVSAAALASLGAVIRAVLGTLISQDSLVVGRRGLQTLVFHRTGDGGCLHGGASGVLSYYCTDSKKH